MSTLSLSLTMGAVGGPSSLAQRALSAIRRNGGTLLLPGLPRNWLDSAGTIAATVDNPVGLVQDSVGSNNATQPTTASKPILRRTDGRYAWQWDGSNDFLQTGITTGNEGWFCAGVTTFSNATTQTLVVNGAGDATANGVWIAKALGSNNWTFNLSDGLGGVRQSIQTPGAALSIPAVQDFGWDGTTAIAATNGAEISVAQTKNVAHTTPLSIGGGIYSFWFNGSMSATVYTPVLPSAADRALIRRFIGSLQGQQL